MEYKGLSYLAVNDDVDKTKKRYDEHGSTYIMIGCNRETDRLDRVLRAYHKALEYAHDANQSEYFRNALVSMYDHKGNLIVVWSNERAREDMAGLVNRGWKNTGEYETHHLVGSVDEVKALVAKGDYW